MSKQENNKDFETSLKKLEKIVSDLENGELPLEESIKTFEEGGEAYEALSKSTFKS